MCMMELPTKTITAESTMGSQSEANETMEISLGLGVRKSLPQRRTKVTPFACRGQGTNSSSLRHKLISHSEPAIFALRGTWGGSRLKPTSPNTKSLAHGRHLFTPVVHALPLLTLVIWRNPRRPLDL